MTLQHSTQSAPSILGYGEFELDIESVLREQLPRFFGGMNAALLTQSNVQSLPAGAKGAYLLLHHGVPVYAGKTDSRHGFRDRLNRHWYTLQHRKNLNIGDMTFKAVRVMVFSNFDVEAILISEMRRQAPQNLEWNDSGFGSNDPGRNREGQEPAKFDKDYPIDIQRPLNVIHAGSHNLQALLAKVKVELPYLLRYDGRRGANTGRANQQNFLSGVNVTVPAGLISMEDFLTLVIRALPGWQATVFPGRVILYCEKQDYQFATRYFR